MFVIAVTSNLDLLLRLCLQLSLIVFPQILINTSYGAHSLVYEENILDLHHSSEAVVQIFSIKREKFPIILHCQ